MDGNVLKYDPAKDDRFSYYFAQREKYKDEHGNYTAKEGDEKYNKQRRLYLAVMEQMNRERALVGEKQLEEKDLITQAYS